MSRNFRVTFLETNLQRLLNISKIYQPYVQEEGASPYEVVEDFEGIPGEGVRAIVATSEKRVGEVLVGNRRMAERLGWPTDDVTVPTAWTGKAGKLVFGRLRLKFSHKTNSNSSFLAHLQRLVYIQRAKGHPHRLALISAFRNCIYAYSFPSTHVYLYINARTESARR